MNVVCRSFIMDDMCVCSLSANNFDKILVIDEMTLMGRKSSILVAHVVFGIIVMVAVFRRHKSSSFR